MECDNIREKLSSYIDGIIPPEERMLIDEHLKTCERCNESLADLKKTLEYVQNLEDIEPPAWTTQKVMERIKAEAKPKKGILQKLFYPLHIKLPLEAAAAILIAVSVLYIFKTIQPEVKLAKIPSEEVVTQVPSVEKDKIAEAPKAPAPVLKEAEAPLETRHLWELLKRMK
jgi:anti-sigma factor RsiW